MMIIINQSFESSLSSTRVLLLYSFPSRLEVVNFGPDKATGSACLANLSAYGKFSLSAAIPFIMAAQLLVTMLIHRANYAWRKIPQLPWNKYTRAFLAMYLFHYTSMA